MIFIGIDNGVTGSIGVIDEQGVGKQFPMPIFKDLNYQKTKVKHISRIKVKLLRELLYEVLHDSRGSTVVPSVKVAIERPMVNPQRFEASTSALRALEATLIVLESLGLGKEYIDSKAWQRELLPYISVKEKKEYPAKLKKVSLEVGQRMYPDIDWENHKDADGILIATYLQKIYGGGPVTNK